MNFTKMHGIGNDYILIDSRDMERDWSKLAIAMCDRHFGIGADGILLVQPSDVADYRMRIYNPDGSEAEACGNGIRMFAKYLVEQGLTPPDTSEIKIQTLGAVGTVQVRRENGRINSVRASMGRPRLKPSEIPVALKEDIDVVKAYPLRVDGRELALTCISMGNPHAVLFTGEPVDRYPLSEIGPQVENHPFFPSRVNFEVVNVIDRKHVEVRVWERGVGETLACGSGACAVGVAARLHDVADSPLRVSLLGGDLTIEWDGEGEVYMTGPAEYVFTGQWEES
ncbi:MAG: diaminopimelate epimerase [Chloroflexi bacterium]|nr:diaminopimelate epimerase [Chloroflexota bacterium]